MSLRTFLRFLNSERGHYVIGDPTHTFGHEDGGVAVPNVVAGDAAGSGKSVIGQQLYTQDGQLRGQLLKTNAGFVYILGPQGQVYPLQGGEEFFTVLGNEPDQFVRLDSAGNITRSVPASNFFPEAPRSTGSRALTLAEQQALIEQQQEFQAGQTAAGQEFTTGEREASQVFQEEAAALAQENRQRESLQGQASALLQQWLSVQQQARDMLTQLQGGDPFRAAANASGQATRGTTPQQAHEANLRATTGQELTFDPSGSVGNLQGQLTDLQHQVGSGLPPPPAFVGAFAHGGTIDMEAGRDGTFRAKGTSPGGFRDVAGRGPVSFVVGESVGGQPNPELVTIDNGRVTVSRFAGGFSHGGSFETASTSNLIQNVAPFFEAAGFQGNVPRFQFGAGGEGALFQQGLRGQPLGTGGQTLRRLGTRPQLVRDSATGQLFFASPDGTLQRFRSMDQFNQLGFNRNEIVNLSQASQAELGLRFNGDFLDDLPDIEPGISSRTPFGQLANPLLLDVGNGQQVALPDPRLLSNLFQRLDVTGQQNLLSAFGNATGITTEQTLGRLRFFTPSGSAQRGATASLR